MQPEPTVSPIKYELSGDTYPTILTISGNYFDFTDPERSKFDIEDIAHALSNLCRFNGHTKVFYSVAQHSVIVSRLCPGQYALDGLLHDAAEAFLGDVTRPLKQRLPDYKAIESHVERAILSRFGLDYPMPDPVRIADITALRWERRELMNNSLHPPRSDTWMATEGVTEPIEKIDALSPRDAYDLFIYRYHQLTGYRHLTGNLHSYQQ